MSPTFNPAAAGTYTFSLVVNDGSADSVPDSVTVRVPILGDRDLDGDVDMTDLNVVMAARNTAATASTLLLLAAGVGALGARPYWKRRRRV
jgi:hypothetical protein